MQAPDLLDRLHAAVRAAPPPGFAATDVDAFIARHRATLLELIRDRLVDREPDLWTPAKRTKANIAAMEVLARGVSNDDDRRILARYSGWGGLSLRPAVRGRFPDGVPVPERAGLIHEYYTPTRVAREVARVLGPFLDAMATPVRSLEPSAGIGRFVRAFRRHEIGWTAIENSPLSARMLAALRPDVALHEGSFESWVTDHGDARFDLVVANPPYGPRGLHITEDPDRRYRQKAAWAYVLLRGLDLLKPNGIGVFVVPSGFLTGKTHRRLRERVLRRHHLMSAYRLPSGLFPGTELVTDLLFFRARGGELAEVDAADQALVDGQYLATYPEHLLGTAVMGRRYRVEGTFERLPDLVERPICAACAVPTKTRPSTRRAPSRKPTKAPDAVAVATGLGQRVTRYLSSTPRDCALLWTELRQDLLDWRAAHGNPNRHAGLKRSRSAAIQDFLSVFGSGGHLLDAIDQPPRVRTAYSGKADDVLAQAEALYRAERTLTVARLLEFHIDHDGPMRTAAEVVGAVTDGGWALDDNQLMPMADYCSGHLWPRFDRAKRYSESGDLLYADQLKQLVEVIQPSVFEDIEGVSPRQGWVPLTLVARWMSETLNARYGRVELVREDGLVQLQGVDYDDISGSSLSPEARWCIGWINHDKTVFKPKKKRHENLDEIRLALGKQWDRSFRDWCRQEPDRLTQVEDAYNRAFRGWVPQHYSAEPLPVGRWGDGIRLHAHQAAAARRLLDHRGGLLAFDVGVGKTYTGIAVMARARQEGWCRRPVILVPNSIVWKWAADIERVLPDYRIAVVGSKQVEVKRGERRGEITSATDSPAERAAKWKRFQQGDVDVVLLTYSALSRTEIDPEAVTRYAERTEAIQREVRLRKRNAGKAKKLSERQEAVLAEGVKAWVAEMLELPESWKPDPGIRWNELGIDLLIVDEAQNYKNLYLPEAREGGVPRFMGNAGAGSKRAWQLDFRSAAVREKNGGSGVVLLSATPAKNSPLEFYNLIQYVDHDVWARQGIRDPEQFIDRYLRIELKPVVDSKMEVVERSAVTGFQNLHELRDTLFRYGEFKTAEDVGLKLPEPMVSMVEVDMDARQADKYASYVAQIEAALDSANDRSQILGLLARMSLTAVHADLDEGYTWRTASKVQDPRSPKFTALAKRVLANRTCGHIVFVDNVAAHRWVRQVLVNAGVPETRIAVLNAITAKASADRQRIAREFNGTDGEPRYDVVIANAIAYEGIDLQTRTCAIHHLDLPWEPATLQQRNGRGVRQGNTLSAIEIVYYFARRSMDGLRFNLIQGKLGWMTELLKSQERATNNPGAQMELGPEEVLLLVSRDPAKTAARLAEVKARREAEARAKVARDAARLLRSADARFRKASRAEDASEAARLRAEAEERLADLARVDPEAWPWAPWMDAVRRGPMLVPPNGQSPVFEGLRARVPSLDVLVEFGRVREGKIGIRRAGEAKWMLASLEDVVGWAFTPADLDPDWVEDVDLDAKVAAALRYTGDWAGLGWAVASDAWVRRAWKDVGGVVIERLASVSGWYAKQQKVPVVNGKLRVTGGSELSTGVVLSPTDAGWARFVKEGAESDLSWSERNACALWWWGRKLARGGAV
jgi:superfamily II DNA or RNA helicase